MLYEVYLRDRNIDLDEVALILRGKFLLPTLSDVPLPKTI